MVRFALHRQHGHDCLRLAGIHVGRTEVTRVTQQRRNLSEHLWKGLNLIQYRSNFALVVGGLRDVQCHHQHRLGIDRGLGVVALLEAPARGGHDARLFVREVDLVAGLGLARRWLRVWPTRLLARLALRIAFGSLGFKLLLLNGVPLARTPLDLDLGLSYAFQTRLAPRDLRRHIQTVIDGMAVALFGQLQQLLHFCPQLGFDLVGVLPGQCPVLAGVGRDLRAVQRDVA